MEKTKKVKKEKLKRVKKVARVEKKIVPEKVELVKKPPLIKREKYYEAEGRRKTAVVRIRLFTRGEKEFLINGKPLEQYFSTFELQQIAKASLEKMKCLDKFRVLALVRGGGLKAQAGAIRHGTARVLVLFNPDFRKRLKAAGFLRRDPRMRERKKFGLKRARRAPQWQKR